MRMFERALKTSSATSGAVVNTGYQDRTNDALRDLIAGREITTDGLDPETAGLIGEIAQLVSHRSERELQRSVDFSLHASNAMAAVSRATGETRNVDTRAQGMAAAIEELDASIGQISQISSSASSGLGQCVETSAASADAVRGAAEKMSVIDESYDVIGQRIDDLQAASGQIGDIVETIANIASQTNLLALNATIEAARAGDAGRGFAVVASEVKTLSGQTQKATEDIRTRIEHLQQQVSAIVSTVDQSKGAVAAGISASEQAAERVQNSVDQLNENDRLVRQISSLMSEQSLATRELATGVSGIAQASSEAMVLSEEVIGEVAGCESIINAAFEELHDRGIPDYVLHRAKSDHFLWKKRLAEMLVGRIALTEEELSDHHSCRLGRWYEAVTDPALLKLTAFQQLLEPHSDVHRLGKRAAHLFAAGELTAAAETIDAMNIASRSVVDLLDGIIESRRPQSV
tara:strand:+ start:476 stop:1861 length:1386 start_codon:yes stop_codon:yes gene_type:complete